MSKLKFVFLTLIVFWTFADSSAAQNTAGTLDTTFGTGGKVTTAVGTGNDIIEDIAVQADGKIVAAGRTVTPNAFVVARYNVNGTIDTTFGTGGIVRLDVGGVGGTNDAYAITVQPNGKILAAGRTSVILGQPSAFAIVRLNGDGSFDTTFDGDGKVTTSMDVGSSQVRAITILPDGKILAGGDTYSTFPNTTQARFAVARYNADGSLDMTFDGDGKVVTELGLGNDTVFSIGFQTDGKVIACGIRSPTTTLFDEDFAVVRYNTNGSLDTTFDTDGIATTEFSTGGWDRAYAVQVQTNGKILAGGLALGGGLQTMAIARFNTDGSLDNSFDTDGKVRIPISAGSILYDMAIQTNGKIVAGGSAGSGGSGDFAAARLNTDGSLDATFGTGGTVQTPVGNGNDQSYAMRIQADGKIVAAGESNNGTNTDFALVRWNGGTRDAIMDFNGDGKTDWAVARRNGPISPWTLYIRYNGSDNFIAQQFGQSPNDLFQPMDYDGDGKDDIAVWRDTGFFYIINSSDNSFRAVFVGGQRGNSAVAADYDGDGKDDPAVFITPITTVGAGNWCYVASLNNPSQQVTCVPWGARYGTQADQVDDPYPGDFDGDGKADFRVQRRTDTANGGTTPAIFYTLTATGAISYDYFGLNSDRIIPGDYDGDGKTDICVARGFNIGTNPPTPIQFFIRHSNGQPDEYINFGNGSNFNFAQGDYDGDGKDDLAFLVAADDNQPQLRYFWVRPSANPNQPIIHQWGASGDLPVAGYNNR
jgi:uncharacterized delta-60 repeat protein